MPVGSLTAAGPPSIPCSPLQSIKEFPERGGANGSIRFKAECDHGANAGECCAQKPPDATSVAAPRPVAGPASLLCSSGIYATRQKEKQSPCMLDSEAAVAASLPVLASVCSVWQEGT